MSFLSKIFNKKQSPPIQNQEMLNYMDSYGYDGETFLNGWGLNKNLQVVNLLALQLRSLQLYRDNSIMGNICDIFQTNVINDGLKLNSTPDNNILKLDEEIVKEKVQEIQTHWNLYASRKISKDKQDTFFTLTQKAYETTLLSGDCVVILEIKNKVPVIQIIDGLYIDSLSLSSLNEKYQDYQGVRIDKQTGEHKGYIVYNQLLEGTFIPCKTARGRTKAYLVKCHTSKRFGDIRGIPLVSNILQMIHEVGRSIASEQRASYVNSLLTMVHTKAEGQIAKSNAFTVSTKNENIQTPKGDNIAFKYGQAGMIRENLRAGEKIESFDTKRPNVNFMQFNDSVANYIGQGIGVPPEVVKRIFNSNYSASRQSMKGWHLKRRTLSKNFGEDFANPIYSLFLDCIVLSGKIELPGYLEAYANNNIDILDAWKKCFWQGVSDENVDVLKQVNADVIAMNNGLKTHEQIASERYGTDFNTNIEKLKEENQKLSEMPTLENRALMMEQETKEEEDEKD